jgi:hypothetical protein
MPLEGVGMKFSAPTASRKWPGGGKTCGERPMVIVAILAIGLFGSGPARATTGDIPLPRPRPMSAPAPGTGAPEKPAASEAPEPPPPSACRLALTGDVAVAPSVAPVRGPGACGGEDLVRLEAVVLPDKGRVAVKPAATLRCPMARAVADWVRTDIAALAEDRGTRPVELDNFDSFDCRGRNGVAGAKLSEHGRANALDVSSFRFADGRTLTLTDREASQDVREKVRESACARFTTVLGPGSDGYHENHVHLDLIERRNGYRICHWDVLGPPPTVAEQPPESAPPRDVAKAQTTPPADSPAVSTKPEPARADQAKPADGGQTKADRSQEARSSEAPLSKPGHAAHEETTKAAPAASAAATTAVPLPRARPQQAVLNDAPPPSGQAHIGRPADVRPPATKSSGETAASHKERHRKTARRRRHRDPDIAQFFQRLFR